jgi:hypothetical protein
MSEISASPGRPGNSPCRRAWTSKRRPNCAGGSRTTIGPEDLDGGAPQGSLGRHLLLGRGSLAYGPVSDEPMSRFAGRSQRRNLAAAQALIPR